MQITVEYGGSADNIIYALVLRCTAADNLALLVADNKGRISFANSQLGQMVGYSPRVLTEGMNIAALLPPPYAQVHAGFMKVCVGGPSVCVCWEQGLLCVGEGCCAQPVVHHHPFLPFSIPLSSHNSSHFLLHPQPPHTPHTHTLHKQQDLSAKAPPSSCRSGAVVHLLHANNSRVPVTLQMTQSTEGDHMQHVIKVMRVGVSHTLCALLGNVQGEAEVRGGSWSRGPEVQLCCGPRAVG